VGGDADVVKPDDLARGVDAGRSRAVRGQGVVQGKVHTPAKEETMQAGGVAVFPDDLARGVDAVGTGASGSEGFVDGGVNAAA
jgi:hypothetical protein